MLCKLQNSTVLILIAICFSCQICNAIIYPDFNLYTNNDIIPQMGFDKAGYSDWWYWGPSARHDPNYGSHEMLCGEWASGIAYSLSGTTKFEWLTDNFSYPDWSTGTSFVQDSGSAWDDPWNFIDGIDTAQSIIHDPNIRIAIDYKLIDLGENGYVAIPFYPQGYSGSDVPYSQSERYVLIQTYNIKNTTSNNITGVKFYQMLNSLVEYPFSSATKSSTYSNVNFVGLLPCSYDPCNPGATNDFRFATTQWNEGDPNEDHVDWISFSSTIEPAWIENGIYNRGSGGDSTPGYITYDIKNSNLNGDPNIYNSYEAAGAMGWDLGTLTPGQTKSITVAAMFGCGTVYYTDPIPPIDVELTITDDINDCVYPSNEILDNYIDYTICFTAGEDVNDVNIVDILPADVDFNSCTGPGDYNETTHTVVWDLGDLDANDVNCFTLNVKVAESAAQGSTITNTAKMYSGNTLLRTTNEQTAICCETTILYVDKNASPNGDGKTWQTAYQELRDALANANTCTEQIWVADGTYAPTDNPYDSSATFLMLDGVDVYGHFGGIDSNETMPCQRNLADNNNITVLTGDLDNDNQAESQYVVTAKNSHLDGFTIKKGNYGIYAAACSPTIANCTIKENIGYYGGMYCDTDTTANITNTIVTNNSQGGIYGYYANINIDKCTISANTEYNLNVGYCNVDALDSVFSNVTGWNGIGIQAGYSNLTLNRCDISDNSSYGESGGHGIYCSKGTTVIEKCHIQRNRNYGIYSLNASESDVVFKNNIISDNGSAGIYTGGGYGGYEGSCQIIDNLVYSNDSNGIYLYGQYYYNIKIRNNTITKNTGYGIYKAAGPEPDVNSNIIYANTIGGLYGDFTNVHYNCIQNCVETNNNINDNPLFRNADANDFHLNNTSPCINTGDPSTSGTNETDIDGEARKIGSAVDMGSDEHCPYDLSLDGCVNFEDFAIVANTWKKSQGDTGYNDYCDFYNDNTIDYRDLEIFCDYWLSPVDWQGIGGDGASFTGAECPLQGGEMMMMSMPPQSSGIELLSSESLAMESVEAIEYVEPPVVSEVEPFDVNETLDWLDDLWTSGELAGSMTEAEFEAFRNSIENYEE